MAKVHKLTGVEPLCSYRENARTILPQKVEEVWTWEPFIRDAARHEELHNMRISIKRLRYTMELFQGVYPNNRQPSAGGSQPLAERMERGTDGASIFQSSFLPVPSRKPEAESQYTKLLAVIVDLQEILGDVHDSDVVLDVLTDYVHRAGEAVFVPGVATLIARTKATRKADYETFLRKWEHLSATGFKQKLLSFLAE